MRYSFRLYYRLSGGYRKSSFNKAPILPKHKTLKPSKFVEAEIVGSKPTNKLPILRDKNMLYKAIRSKAIEYAQAQLSKASSAAEAHIRESVGTKAKEVLAHLHGKLTKTAAAKLGKGFGGIIKNTAAGTISNSAFGCINHEPKGADFFRNATRIRFVTNQSWPLTATSGVQQVGDMSGVRGDNTGYQANALTAYIWGGDNASATKPVSPNLGQGVLSYLRVVGGGVPTAKIHYNKAVVTTEIANSNLNPVIVDIYELVAKRDLCINSAGTYTTNVSPVQMWYTGSLVNKPAVGTVGSAALTGPTNIGSLPYISDDFNDYWAVSAKVRVYMAGASTHVHESTYELNKTISGRIATNSTILAGITRCQMWVLQDTVVHDHTTGGISAGQAVAYISQEIEYSAHMLAESMNVSNYLPYQVAVTTPETTVISGTVDEDTLGG